MRFERLVAAAVLGLLAGIGGCGGDDGTATAEPGSSSGTGSSGASESSSSGGSTSSGGPSSSGSSGASSSSGASGTSSSSGGPSANPWLVQCFYGAAVAGFDASNPDIEAACQGLTQAKVKTCTTGDCPIGFGFRDANAAYTALFAALDTNDDDAVDGTDTLVDLALIGHSWGGTNVADIGKRLLDDARVDASRKKVKLAVVWDPYRPGYELRPSTNFERFLVLRQSASPDGDCSEGLSFLGGPFKGLAPRCAAGQGCEDHDYSLSGAVVFPAFPSGTMKGSTIGHCDVPNVGIPVAKAILDGTALPPLPQSVPVAVP